MALIARHGGDWFRPLGTDEDPGTALVTLSRRGPGSRRLRDRARRDLAAIADRGRRRRRRAAAGAAGGRLRRRLGRRHRHPRAAALPRVSWGRSALGSGPGSSSPSAGAPARSPRPRASRDWLSEQSAGQCGPCVNGLASIADAMGSIRGRRRPSPAQTRRPLVRAGHRPRRLRASRRRRGVRRQRPAGVRPRTARPCPPWALRRLRGAGRAHPLRRPRGALMRIEVDPIACDAHGLCAELLPELIALDEWGYPIVDPRRGPAWPAVAGPPRRVGLPDARAAAVDRRPVSAPPSTGAIGGA